MTAALAAAMAAAGPALLVTAWAAPGPPAAGASSLTSSASAALRFLAAAAVSFLGFFSGAVAPSGSIFLLPEPAQQGLTLDHFSAQRKHMLWDTLGAQISPSPSDRGTRGGVTKTS